MNTGSLVWAAEESAEYTVQCTIMQNNQAAISIPDNMVSIMEGDNRITGIQGKYFLKKNTKYTYKISGKEIDAEGTITTGEEEVIAIGIDKDKLKVIYPDRIYVGQKAVPESDNLVSGCTWSLSDASEPYADIVEETGEITGKAAGTIKVVKTYGATGITVTQTLNVEEKSKQFSLKYKVNDEVWENEIADKDVQIMADGKPIDITEGKCMLICGRKYTYSIKKNGFTEEEQIFTAPAEGTDNVVNLSFKLVLPELTADGKDLGDVNTKIKTGAKNLPIQCSNSNALYGNIKNWSVQIGANSLEINAAMKIAEVKKNQEIRFLYLDKDVGGVTLNTFDNYEIEMQYAKGGTTISISGNPTLKDSKGTACTLNDLKAGCAYTVDQTNVTGCTYTDDEKKKVKFVPTFYDEKITLALNESNFSITKPEIQVGTGNGADYIGTYGDKVSLKVKNEDKLFKGNRGGWSWEPIGEIKNQLNIANNKLTLGGIGKAQLKYVYKVDNKVICESNEINIEVEKIKLNFQKNATLKAEKRTYDFTNIFKIECNAGDNALFYVERLNNNDFVMDDTLVITGQVESENVKYTQAAPDKELDSYKELTIVSVERKGVSSEDIYDFTNLEGKKIKVKDAIITPVTLYTKIGTKKNLISVQYNTKKIDDEKTKLAIQFFEKNDSTEEMGLDIELKTKFKEDIYGRIGEFKIENEADRIGSFSKITEPGKSIKDENGNVEYIFSSVQFKFNYIPEIIDYLAYEDLEVELRQNNEEKINGSWINSTDIEAVIHRKDYQQAYSQINFQKISEAELKQGKIACQAEISEALPELRVDTNVQEQYYRMIFSLQGKYATVAAVIRIISQSAEEDKSYPEKLEASDGNTYKVINLFLSEKAGKVTLENSEGIEMHEVTGMNANEMIKEIKQSGAGKDGKKELAFRVENEGAELREVSYAYIPYEEVKKLDVPTVQQWSIVTEPWIGVHTVSLPNDEKDYILLVKTVNEANVKSVYASDVFVIDWTRPKIRATYKETLPNRSTAPGFSEAERDYRSTGTDEEGKSKGLVLKIEIEEKHLKEANIELTATDFHGETIEEALLKEEKEKFENELLKNQKDGICTAELCFFTDANYTLRITAKDVSGNKGIRHTEEENGAEEEAVYYFTLDNGAPEEGEIRVKGRKREVEENEGKKKGIITTIRKAVEGIWSLAAGDAAEMLFTRNRAVITMSGEDRISPVTLSYFITDHEMGVQELGKAAWTAYDRAAPPKTELNRNSRVYARVEDEAGNISYFGSEGIISDNEEPEIEVEFKKKPNEKGFYHGDVQFTVEVTEKTAAVNGAASGLKLVSWRTENGKEVTKAETVYEGNETDASVKRKSFTGKAGAEENNSNSVTLYVTAVDNAGNRTEYKKELKIDRVRPEITVSYDNNRMENGRYYNEPRTATVRIKERNLDTGKVRLTAEGSGGGKAFIGAWSSPAEAGKSDEAEYTCQVSFTEDDDYVFTVSCEDEAGNRSTGDYHEEFTLDTTKPEIRVSYNGREPEEDAYYNEEITAEITITEHNFDAAKVRVRTEGGSGQGGEALVTGFRSSGDVHTAEVRYDRDGEYRLTAAYTDEAGNAAEEYAGKRFVVDMTEPEIEIINVGNRSANAGEVKPVVICRDENYEESLVDITLSGANSGELKLAEAGYAKEKTEEGGRFAFDFPKTEKMDDVYVLKAEIKDKAGNGKKAEVEFSVNRYGSVYTLGTETGEWLESGVCAYVRDAREVEIIETNVNEIVESKITCSHGGVGGDTAEIKEIGECSGEEREAGRYYEKWDVPEERGWKRKSYTIAAANFGEEGTYRINIYSRDEAGNETSSVSNRHAGGKLSVEFAVDRTAPSIVFSGAEDGGMYNEAEHTVLVDVQDNIALSEFTVYVDGEEYGRYTEKELKEYGDGLVPVKVEQSLARQRIQVKAEDRAGNRTGEEEGKEPEGISILVTTNGFVRFMNRSWLLVVVLLLLAVAAVSYIVYRRKRESIK
ncbi:MAG: Ig-like domain-containing protein [Clostridium sp.]|nr:Ig-like domain-containing protein [Clostridium sp.]